MATIDNRQQWLAERRSGIGASEAAAVLGLSPWMTPLELFMRKSGLVPEQEQTQLMRFGLMWEKFLIQLYAEDSGRDVVTYQEFMRHPDVPFIFATLDCTSDDRIVELKKVSGWAADGFGPAGSDEIPIHYRIQVQQQMACTEFRRADLAALIGDDDFRIYTVERDDALIAKLIDAETEFWRRVQESDPPMPDYTHPTTLEVLRMIEPHAGEVVRLGEDVCALADAYDTLGEYERAAKEARDNAKARIIHAMGSAGVAYLADGRTIERKTIHRRGYEVAPSQYVSFSIKAPKNRKAIQDGSESTIERIAGPDASEAPGVPATL